MSRLLYALVPPFALFGPLFIAQSIPGLPLWRTVFASVGALMLGLAVVAVMLRQRAIEAQLDALDGSKPETPKTVRTGGRMRRT
jgi:hypothetical protein